MAIWIYDMRTGKLVPDTRYPDICYGKRGLPVDSPQDDLLQCTPSMKRLRWMYYEEDYFFHLQVSTLELVNAQRHYFSLLSFLTERPRF
jgi:hypothetical protein